MRGKISKIIARKTGVDWAIFGGVTLVLAGFLVYVTHLTPYRPPVQTIYTTAPSNATSFQRARIVSDAINGTLSAAVVDGAQAGETVTVLISPLATDNVSPGDAILITKNPTANTQNQTFSYIDRWRLPALGVLLALFVLFVTLVGGRRGVASIIGLLVSVLIVGWFMIPNIVQGGNVIITTIISAYVIAIVSILIAHGWRKRTFISIACICAILTGIMLIAGLTTWLTALSGIADELAFYLAKDNQWLDMRGLIISGIIIASLGVLDDVVTTQVATVEELHKSNPALSRRELFRAASSVGSEHITSLVNTLALAYVGASLPFIIMLTMRQINSPLITVNGEYIATEVVRTLVASIGLVVAVPVSTGVATWVYTRSAKRDMTRRSNN